MNKPALKTEQYYDLMSIIYYVTEKHKINVNDTTLWHWIVDTWEVDNGEIFSICTSEFNLPENKAPAFIKEIMNHLHLEFGSELNVRVSW